MLKKGCAWIGIMNFDKCVSLETIWISQGGPMVYICVPVLYLLVISLFPHMQKSHHLSSDILDCQAPLPIDINLKKLNCHLYLNKGTLHAFSHTHISIHSPQYERC